MIEGKSTFCFKCYIIISMIFIWTGYTLLVRHTSLKAIRYPKEKMYASTTVVLLSEIVKMSVTLFFIFKTKGFNILEFQKTLKEEYVSKPVDLLKMSVPSVLYAVQNNLDFVALSYLDAATYQVTTQLKVVTTALFMVLMLGRIFSARRWIAIIMLFCGVAAVQLNDHDDVLSVSKVSDKYLFGIIAVLVTCVTAGFSGVYFEMMLKDGTATPFWIRNLQMYSCGVVSASLGCFFGDYGKISSDGFFHGYNFEVMCIVVLLGLGGLFISLVMKYLDNLYKSFAAAVSIILVVTVSFLVFERVHIGTYFVVGSATVIGAIFLYNSVTE